MPTSMFPSRRRHGGRLPCFGLALAVLACSKQDESRDLATADTTVRIESRASPSRIAPEVSAPAPIDHPAVLYVEATESEVEAARKGISKDDFAVIADDLMFYRSSALERLEEWNVPFSRVPGRRPIQFTVDGKRETIDFAHVTTLDFIIVYRPNERPRAFAPNEIDEVRVYWESGAAGRD